MWHPHYVLLQLARASAPHVDNNQRGIVVMAVATIVVTNLTEDFVGFAACDKGVQVAFVRANRLIPGFDEAI